MGVALSRTSWLSPRMDPTYLCTQSNDICRMPCIQDGAARLTTFSSITLLKAGGGRNGQHPTCIFDNSRRETSSHLLTALEATCWQTLCLWRSLALQHALQSPMSRVQRGWSVESNMMRRRAMLKNPKPFTHTTPLSRYDNVCAMEVVPSASSRSPVTRPPAAPSTSSHMRPTWSPSSHRAPSSSTLPYA